MRYLIPGSIVFLTLVGVLMGSPSVVLPRNLTHLAFYPPPSASELIDIEISGDLAFVSAGRGGLSIIDISDPSAPAYVTNYRIGAEQNWCAQGDHLYGSERHAGITVVDISLPSDPTYVTDYRPSSKSYEHADGSGGHLFAATHTDGIEIIEPLLSSSPAQPRTVLVELFGATWCYNCSLASAAIDSLAREFGPDSLIVLEYHWADELAIPEGEDRARWYVPGPFNIPNTWFEGVINVVGATSGVYDTFRGHLIDRLNVPSPLSIDLEVSPIGASASIRVVGPLSEADLRAYFVVYENDVEDRYDYVVRDILPTEDLSLSSVGDSAVVVREFDSYPDCDPERTGIVVFVQSDGTKSILQAASEFVAFCPSDNQDTLQSDDVAGTLRDYKLFQNYPNPFNPTTTVEFVLPRSGDVRICIFNILGQTVRTLVDEHREAGCHLAEWDGIDDSGRGVATGVYFYQLNSPEFVQTRRMVLIR